MTIGHWTTEHIIAEGNILAAHWSWSGTYTVPVPGVDVEPTGKEVTGSGMGFHRFEGGRITEMWFTQDALGWFHQLGVAPPMGEDKT